MKTEPHDGHPHDESSAARPRPVRRPAVVREDVLALLLLALVLAAFAASRLAIAGVPSEREYDEGVYLLSARAVARGGELFTQVFSSQPPAFVETLALAFRVFGDRLAVARGVIFAFALLSLTSVAWIARRMAGPWAAPAAAAALALSVTFSDLAHVVSAEMPALGVALASIALCLESRRNGWDRGRLIASGALLALAGLFKLIVAPFAAPFGLLLLLAPLRHDQDEYRLDRQPLRILGRCLTVGVGAALVIAVPLLVYDRAKLYDQVIGFHLSKHEVFELNQLANLRRAAGHLRTDAILSATAALGFVLMVLRRRRPAAAWLLAWLLAMTAAIALQTPLFWRHFVLLCPPVAIAAGAAAALAGGGSRPRQSLLTVATIAIWASVTLYNDRGIFPLMSDGARSEKSHASLTEVARWIEKNTRDDELVVSDDPIAVYLSGRGSPPAMVDTSSSRIAAESLQVEEAARESLLARVIVLGVGGRLSSLPGYVGWLKKNYDEKPHSQTGVARRTVWIRKPEATATATNPPSMRRNRDVRPPRAEAPGN